MMVAVTEAEAGFARILSEDGREVRLAMQELRLTGTLLPVGARLLVRHIFKSAERRPLEVVYSFVLPRDAALRRFRMQGEGFEVHSELKPVREAEKIYEEGIEKGHLSSLAKVYRDGVVNLNVGNIRPGETVIVELELLAGVELHDDGFRFRFPFTLSPAYHSKAKAVLVGPGKGEMELPGDQFGDVILPTWTKDSGELHGIGFELKVNGSQALREVSSPSHPLGVQNLNEMEVVVTLPPERDLPNRDLVLDVKYRDASASFLTGVDEGGMGRFAAVIPSVQFGQPARNPKQVVFLLDRSGSMSGLPIEQAKRALEACLGALSEEDRFALIAFDDRVERLSKELLSAGKESRGRAKDFLARIDARGGTELLAGLHEATRLVGPIGGEILVITDGQVMATEDIIQGIRERGVRVHCLGIGSASQDRFLTLLARQTGGVSRFLTPRERVDLAALELFSAVSSPVATKIGCEIKGFQSGAIVPDPLTVVFGGTPLLLMGSCEGKGEGHLRLTWECDGEHQSIEVPLAVQDEGLGETLKLLQGARRITDLESQGSGAAGARAEAKRVQSRQTRMLEELSREYGLASRAMALCAVYAREGDVAGQLPLTRVVPVGLPQDVDFSAYFSPGVPSMRCCYEPLYDMRPIARRRRSVRSSAPPTMMKSAPERSIVGQLVEIGARLEPDGGMPGKDSEERILASLIALVLFYQEGNTVQQGAFRPHVQRLVSFLQAQDLRGLDQASRDLVLELVLKVVTEEKAIVGDWKELAEKFVLKRKMRVSVVWRQAKRIAR